MLACSGLHSNLDFVMQRVRECNSLLTLYYPHSTLTACSNVDLLDYTGDLELIAHGFAADERQAARLAWPIKRLPGASPSPAARAISTCSSLQSCTSSGKARALARARPGRLNMASLPGSSQHLAGAYFEQIAGVRMTHVPYKGGNAHIMDLIGGRIPVIFDTATNSMPLLRGGKVRALAVGTPARLPDLPGTPTFAESGFPQFQFTAWYGVFAPAKTPKDVVAKLSAALATALKNPEVIAKLNGVGVSVASGDSAELAKLVPVEYERIGKLIKTANIKAD